MTEQQTHALGRGQDVLARSRRIVAQTLEQVGLDELTEDAELVTSELVGNALLHTDSDVRVSIGIDGDTVRVEVHDDSPVLPVPGVLGAEAMSGRGLILVEQLTHRWGVTRVPGSGKNVWFELVAGVPTSAEELTADELLDLWDLGEDLWGSQPVAEPALELAEPGEQIKRLRLEGVATSLLIAAKCHIDDLVRELTLAAECEAVDTSGAAGDDSLEQEICRLGRRIAELTPDLMYFRNEMRRQALEAHHLGLETLTLELELPVSLRAPLEEYGRLLDRADELCGEAEMLIDGCDGPHVEFRRWKISQFIKQLDS